MNDEELLATNAHIPTKQVLVDIADTEAEIVTMTKEIEHLEQTPNSLPGYRLAQMQASARRDGIEKRKVFIARLQYLLKLRSEVVA